MKFLRMRKRIGAVYFPPTQQIKILEFFLTNKIEYGIIKSSKEKERKR